MSYELLLADLDTLQKGYAADADDKAIQAAAGDNADDKEELDEDGKPVAKKKKPQAEPGCDDCEPGKPFGKSFTLVGEDGVETEAIDGTELVKALHQEVAALGASAESEKADLTKSIGILANVIKSQGALIKSLQDNYAALANQGAGRKSVMTPSADMAKSMQPMNTETFMMKANEAFNAGRISGKDLTICDVSLRHGEPVDAAVLNRIFAN